MVIARNPQCSFTVISNSGTKKGWEDVAKLVSVSLRAVSTYPSIFLSLFFASSCKAAGNVRKYM
jgi:hypothetical protein